MFEAILIYIVVILKLWGKNSFLPAGLPLRNPLSIIPSFLHHYPGFHLLPGYPQRERRLFQLDNRAF